MPRKRLLDFRLECDPEDVGLCLTNQDRIAHLVNKAQRRLLYSREAGDEGWYGTFAEMAYTASRTNPYITTSRHVARLIKLSLCQKPIHIQNPFDEYLQFGNGNLPKTCVNTQPACSWNAQAFTRNNAVTFVDLTNAPQYLRIYTQDTTGMDDGRRVLVQGTDSNGNILYSRDNGYQVNGIFVTLGSPFTDLTVEGSQIAINTITGIQKDITEAPIQIFQVDPTTGAEVLISSMEPSEKVAGYRRYYLNSLPTNCCGDSATTVQLTAIVKLELIPVVADTDYLLIQNVEAIKEECMAVFFGTQQGAEAKAKSDWHHKQAIRYLQGEITHYLGKEKPAVSFHPLGTWDAAAHGIGQL